MKDYTVCFINTPAITWAYNRVPRVVTREISEKEALSKLLSGAYVSPEFIRDFGHLIEECDNIVALEEMDKEEG